MLHIAKRNIYFALISEKEKYIPKRDVRETMSKWSLPHNHGFSNSEIIYTQLSHDEKFATAAELLRQVADPVKIKIFWLLSHGEECVINISAFLGMTSPAVSHHLRPMRELGIISARREGQEVYYKIQDSEQCKLLHRTIEAFMEIVCPKDTETHTHRREHLVEAVREYLIENLDKRITVEQLSKKFLVNTTTLKKIFREKYGAPIGEYVNRARMEKAKDMLKSDCLTVAEISKSLGYTSPSRFSESFKRAFGLLPREYRKDSV